MATVDELALLSKAAYGGSSEALPPYWTQINIDQYGNFFTDPNTGFAGALYGHISGVGADGKYIYDQVVMAIRGTQPTSITDLLNDFDIMKGNDFEQEVSLIPFYNAINATLPNLNLTANVEKYITGQSLGGALAELLGATTGIETVTFEAFGAAYLNSSPQYT